MLQDVHWSHGYVGSFPTYTLGNIMSSQLFAAARQAPGVAEGLETGDYAPLHGFMRDNVWQHGRAADPGRDAGTGDRRTAGPRALPRGSGRQGGKAGGMSVLAPQPAIVTADLYDAHHDRLQVIDLQFRSFGRVETFFGPCATVRTFHDHTPVLTMLDSPGEGRVLVVDAKGSLTVGVMGDRLAEKGAQNGWRGVVIAGAIRDSAGIDALDLGVRALGTTARRGWHEVDAGFGEVLWLGGAQIREGDWIYADRDSVIVAPAELPLDGGGN